MGDEDWTPYQEVAQALEHLHWVVSRRWSRQACQSAVVPVSKDLQDALADLRPLVREASAIWERLGRYAPRKEQS